MNIPNPGGGGIGTESVIKAKFLASEVTKTNVILSLFWHIQRHKHLCKEMVAIREIEKKGLSASEA